MNPVPRLTAGVVALASVGLLALALCFGWLGPDAGRGGSFCEAARDAIVRQPANTFSNLGFVIAGLAIAWHVSRRGSGAMSVGLGTAYAVLVVLLGPGSAAMHASQSVLGGHLDVYSMYLLAGFVFSYAASRLFGLGAAGFAGVYVVVLGVCTIAEFTSADVPLVMTMGNAAFAVLLLAGLVMEVVLRARCEPTRSAVGCRVARDAARGLRDLEHGQGRWPFVRAELSAATACRVAPARCTGRVAAVPVLCEQSPRLMGGPGDNSAVDFAILARLHP